MVKLQKQQVMNFITMFEDEIRDGNWDDIYTEAAKNSVSLSPNAITQLCISAGIDIFSKLNVLHKDMFKNVEYNLGDTFVVNSNIKDIEANALDGLEVKNLVLKNKPSDGTLRRDMLQGCKYETITIGENYSTLGQSCIDSDSLKKIIIPDTLSKLDAGVFRLCSDDAVIVKQQTANPQKIGSNKTYGDGVFIAFHQVGVIDQEGNYTPKVLEKAMQQYIDNANDSTQKKNLENARARIKALVDNYQSDSKPKTEALDNEPEEEVNKSDNEEVKNDFYILRDKMNEYSDLDGHNVYSQDNIIAVVPNDLLKNKFAVSCEQLRDDKTCTQEELEKFKDDYNGEQLVFFLAANEKYGGEYSIIVSNEEDAKKACKDFNKDCYAYFDDMGEYAGCRDCEGNEYTL